MLVLQMKENKLICHACDNDSYHRCITFLNMANQMEFDVKESATRIIVNGTPAKLYQLLSKLILLFDIQLL